VATHSIENNDHIYYMFDEGVKNRTIHLDFHGNISHAYKILRAPPGFSPWIAIIQFLSR